MTFASSSIASTFRSRAKHTDDLANKKSPASTANLFPKDEFTDATNIDAGNSTNEQLQSGAYVGSTSGGSPSGGNSSGSYSYGGTTYSFQKFTGSGTFTA